MQVVQIFATLIVLNYVIDIIFVANVKIIN